MSAQWLRRGRCCCVLLSAALLIVLSPTSMHASQVIQRPVRQAQSSAPRIPSIPVKQSRGQVAWEVVALLRNLTLHLPGCHKVILYKNSDNSRLEEDLTWALAVEEEVQQVWALDTFLTATPPASYVFRRTQEGSGGRFCVVFLLLAQLQWVGAALRPLQRGSWFPGSTKYVVCFSPRSIDPDTLLQQPHIRESYNLVVVSRVLQQEEEASGSQSLSIPEYQLLQICPYCDAGQPQAILAATWTPTAGFRVKKPFFPDLFQDFQGHVMRVVTLVYEPFSCYEKVGQVITPAEHCVDNYMLKELAASLNFTYAFVEPKDGQWGHRLENGSYTGVIGTVERLEADFSLNVAITQDREEVVDCTVGYHVEPITFATSKPRVLNQALALIRPFSPSVWMAFLVTMVLAGPFYHLVCYWSRGLRPLHHTSSSFMSSCLRVFGACFNQGVKWESAPASRVFTGAYVLAMLVAVTMYVAMLTASLTLPTRSPAINTLHQLVQSDFSWGIQDLGAADYQLFKTSKVPLYQEVYQGLDPCPNLDACITLARDTKFAFITWRTYLQDRIALRFTSAAGEPQLHVASGDIFPVELGWAMTPGCPFRAAFDARIYALTHSGLISKWLGDLINDPKRREAAEAGLGQADPVTPALGMHHLQGAFFLLGMGCGLSFLAFICEVVLRGRNGQDF